MVDLKWFNANPNLNRTKKGTYWSLFNLFNRVSNQGHFWGFGVLQIGSRHLFFIGSEGVSILFIGKA